MSSINSFKVVIKLFSMFRLGLTNFFNNRFLYSFSIACHLVFVFVLFSYKNLQNCLDIYQGRSYCKTRLHSFIFGQIRMKVIRPVRDAVVGGGIKTSNFFSFRIDYYVRIV